MTTLTRANGLFAAPPGTKLLGEIITWSCAKVHIRHIDLVAALHAGDLAESVARELAPRHAFARACPTLSEARIIRPVAEDEVSITFQFTAEHRRGDHFTYDPETMLTLDKATGQVTCGLPALATLAQAEAAGARRRTGRGGLAGCPGRHPLRPAPSPAPGSRGEVVATDGQQLLVQGGFAFPWDDDVLVAGAGALAAPELPKDGGATVGRTATHVWVRVGPWSFALAVDAAGLFPDVALVIPRARADATKLVLDAADGAALAAALPALPGADEEHRPVTLDLNGHAAVRARAAGQPRATEVDLPRAAVTGPAVRLVTDRFYLARALRLGFTEFAVAAADKPVVGRDAARTYLWITLSPAGALPPDPEARRVRLPRPDSGPAAPRTLRRPRPMPTNSTDSTAARPQTGDAPRPAPAPRAGVHGLLDEAQALQRSLREAGGRAARLAAALRRHRRRSKLVQSTLASLKQLPLIEA